MNYNIIHNQEKKRFEVTVDGFTAELRYNSEDDSGVWKFTHTGVPKELEGKGVGSALVKFALDYAKQQGWKVDPVCPFVKIYVDRHPGYQEISI